MILHILIDKYLCSQQICRYSLGNLSIKILNVVGKWKSVQFIKIRVSEKPGGWEFDGKNLPRWRGFDESLKFAPGEDDNAWN